MSASVTVRAPGKVNLQLSVGPVGADGYHPLATVFQAISVDETVTATVRSDDSITVTVTPDHRGVAEADTVPVDDSNLAVRAAIALRDTYGIDAGVDLHITKGVPVAAGMAGGSADAAAALVACAQVWDLDADASSLAGIAASLGADVPFALHGGTAVGTGRGDQLTSVPCATELTWVLATQRQGLSTPAVYAEFDRVSARTDDGSGTVLVGGVPQANDALLTALSDGDIAAVGGLLANDLQQAALTLAPHLTDVFDAARRVEVVGVMVSGSGPTVAALASSRDHAAEVADYLRSVRVADRVLIAAGPAPGARLV